MLKRCSVSVNRLKVFASLKMARIRLSRYELEETVSIMVKSSQPTPGLDKLVKPSWWPVAYQFPLKRHPGMDEGSWREILHNLISKCYQFNNRERQRSKRLRPSRKHVGQRGQRSFRRNSGGDDSDSVSGSSTTLRENGRGIKLQTKRKILENKSNTLVSSIVNGRMRRDSTGSSSTVSSSSRSGGTVPLLEKEATRPERSKVDVRSGLVRPSSGDSNTSHSEVSVAEVLAKNLGLSQKLQNRVFSPVVQVYDVCKVNPSFIKFDNNNLIFRKNENCDVIKRDINVEKNDFMNYFGLDTKSTSAMLPNVDTSQNTVTYTKLLTHKNNLVNCPHVPLSSNVGLKLIKDWHNYDNDVIDKRLERLERYLCNSDLPSLLTPVKEEFKVVNNKNSGSRARLNHFYIFPTKKRHKPGKLTPKARFFLKKYCKPCYVNLSASGDNEIKKYFDCRKHKQIIDLNTENEVKQKENKTPFTLLESRVVLTAIDKFKENSSTSSLVKKVDRSNFALQTLAPRNENLCESTNPGKSPTKLVNFINPSVVLQPIHELFEFTKRGKILHSAHKVARLPYKVVKTRVNVYNPRRFSTRLHEVNV